MTLSLTARVKRKLRGLLLGPPPEATDLPEVRDALRAAEPPPLPAPDAALQDHVDHALAQPRPDSRALFTVAGELAACWREEDLDPRDPWLLSRDYYPLYHSLLRELRPCPAPRLLEIGVRTGYLAVVFARATAGAGHYVGVDPDVYLPDGLKRARRALRQVGREYPALTSEFIAGSSHDPRIRQRLQRMPRFDLIHIDGDHSLEGKIADLALARDLLAPGGLVLVDDFTHMASVPLALRHAFARGWYRRFATAPTMRGLALLG